MSEDDPSEPARVGVEDASTDEARKRLH